MPYNSRTAVRDWLETIRGFAVFDPSNTFTAANRAYLAIFDGLDMVRPGITMSTLVELLANEGICDIGEMTPTTGKVDDGQGRRPADRTRDAKALERTVHSADRQAHAGRRSCHPP